MAAYKFLLPALLDVWLTWCYLVSGKPGSPQEDERQQQADEPKLVVHPREHHFELPKPMSFDEYCRTFGKEYATAGERLARHKRYTDRLVKSLRSQVAYLLGMRDDFLGVTQYSDLTDEERAQVCPLCYASQSGEQGAIPCGGDGGEHPAPLEPMSYAVSSDGQSSLYLRSSAGTPGVSAPIKIELPDSRCLSAVKDQGKCGSCYIFATVAALEYMFCKHNGRPIAFSEQYVVDCGPSDGLNGCYGDSPHSVLRFSARWGIHSLDGYPNTGKQGVCPCTRNTTRAAYRLSSEEVVDVSYLLWPSLLRRGVPVIVSIFVRDRDFLDYAGGVASPPCGTDLNGHSLLLVGMDHDDGGLYYKFRNSFGEKWGENGHYHLRARCRCFTLMGAVPADMMKNDERSAITENAPVL
jgi:hypothetical protein